MWCTDDQRSLRNADKAGMTGFQFFLYDGTFPLMQIVKEGVSKRALFDIPPDGHRQIYAYRSTGKVTGPRAKPA